MIGNAYFSLGSTAFSFPCILQVFFKSGDGYRDVFGVAWPLRSDLLKVQTTVLRGAAFQHMRVLQVMSSCSMLIDDEDLMAHGKASVALRALDGAFSVL